MMSSEADGPGLAALGRAIVWRFRRRQAGVRPGAHRGRFAGADGLFTDLAPILACPDPRRLDLRRSVVDPFGMPAVRRFELPTTVTVHVVVDLSASLASRGASDRHRLAALLAGAFAEAAHACGDASALAVALGSEAEFALPPGRGRERTAAFRDTVLSVRPSGTGIEGLLGIAAALPRRRTLVVLISDMELAPTDLDAVLAAFDGHALIPVWLRDSALEAIDTGTGPLPGIARMQDPETGRTALVVLGRRRVEAWRAGRERRREELQAVLASRGREAVTVLDRVQVAAFAEALARVLP